MTRPTPERHRRRALPPPGFGLPPVRSPLLGGSSLFLGVLRCFSSPGALRFITGALPSRRAGCPIRRPPDRWLPAPPRGVSPRGRVLPRPTTPRHPPCAHLRYHYSVTNALHPRLEASEARPTRARGTKIPRNTPSILCLVQGRSRSLCMWCARTRKRDRLQSSTAARPRRPHASGCQRASWTALASEFPRRRAVAPKTERARTQGDALRAGGIPPPRDP